MMNDAQISKNHLKELTKLRKKKYRLETGKVVVEGLRTLAQLQACGLLPHEQYVTEGHSGLWKSVPTFYLREWEMQQLCDSEHSQNIAALFELPPSRTVQYTRAFLLDEISDPGNMGTIFRIAASFAIDQIFLTPSCVEVSSPKVIRASLGSVFQVPFSFLDFDQIVQLRDYLAVTDAKLGSPLGEFHPAPEEKVIVVLGSEAHGISSDIMDLAARCIRIGMADNMESLNVAVAAGIIGHHLYANS